MPIFVILVSLPWHRRVTCMVEASAGTKRRGVDRSDDAERARQRQTQQTLKRWRLCGWPRHESSNSPGSGNWETLSVDCKMLKSVKKCLDKRLAAPASADADSQGGMQALGGDVKAEGCAEHPCSPEGATFETQNLAGAVRMQSETDCSSVREGEEDKARPSAIGDASMLELSQLAGKILSDIAAEEERRQRAEQLRLMAEAEAKRKQERIRRQLGDAAVSSTNIISDRPERRARTVVNYAVIDKKAERELRRYVNYTEFGKGKNPFGDSGDESDDDSRRQRKRVTRVAALAPEPVAQESRADRLRRRAGVEDESAGSSSRPRRAAALASSYGERRESSRGSDKDEWVSGESEGEDEKEHGRKPGIDDADLHEDEMEEEEDQEENGAEQARCHGAKGSAFAATLNGTGAQQSMEQDAGDDASPRKRRRIVEEEEEEGEAMDAGEHSARGGARPCDKDEKGAQVPAAGQSQSVWVRDSSDPAAIKALIRGRERRSWVGCRVRKFFPQHGCWPCPFGCRLLVPDPLACCPL